jgi:hypothetical protein
MLMVLCELLLVGVVLRCRRVVVFRVVILLRAFCLLLFSGSLPFVGLLLRKVCHFSAFLLGVAVRRVDVVRRRTDVRHLMVFCFVGKQVYRWNMFAGRKVALLMVFCLFVEYLVAYCIVELVDWYCTCPDIVTVGVRRACCRLCLLLTLTCNECLMVTYSCHIVTLVPQLRLDMEEAVMLLEPTSIEIIDWFRSPLVEVLEHSMLQS